MLEKIKNRFRNLRHSRLPRIAMILMLGIATVAVSGLMILSVKTVVITDGKNQYTVHSMSGDVQNALACVKLASKDYEIISTEMNNDVTKVQISYVFPVYITVGDNTQTVLTAGGTVGEILKKAGYTVDQFDFVEPGVDKVITETAYIDYTDINYVNGSYEEKIPGSVDVVYANYLAEGSQQIQKGSDGVKVVKYTEKFVNGQSVEKNITGVEVLSAAVNTKKLVGTKKASAPQPSSVITGNDVRTISTLVPATPIQLDANGVPVNYTKHLTVQATAYTYTGHNCSTGVTPQPGYIAVNPKIIPYGTKMYIKSSDGRFLYGYAVAADTGGFSKKHPTNVDLFFSTRSACSSFGRRNVEIYILP